MYVDDDDAMSDDDDDDDEEDEVDAVVEEHRAAGGGASGGAGAVQPGELANCFLCNASVPASLLERHVNGCLDSVSIEPRI